MRNAWVHGFVAPAAYLLLACHVSCAAAADPSPEVERLCSHYEKSWTYVERFLWNKLCLSGRVSGEKVPRASAKDEPPVRAAFLETLLTVSPYRERIDETGLHMERVDIVGPLRISDFRSSSIELTFVTIEGDLLFDGGVAKKVYLHQSHVKGDLYLLDTKIDDFFAYHLVVDRSIQIDRSQFKFLSLPGVRVGDELQIDDSYGNWLELPNAHVIGRVTLFAVHLGKKSEAQCPKLDEPLKAEGSGLILDGLTTTSTVDLTSSEFEGPVSISDAAIDGSLVLSGASIHCSMEVSDTRIGRKLVLEPVPKTGAGALRDFRGLNGRRDILWGSGSSFSLKDTTVNIIAARQGEELWPRILDLRNLSFNSFDVTPRPSPHAIGDWFRTWLSKSDSVPYNPQPYERVRLYLTSIGELQAANEVGMAGKNLELAQACKSFPYVECAFLAFSRVTVGYGYELWLAAFWSAGFVIVGAYVFRRTEAAYRNKMPYGWAYSFDTFIPLIKLREKHYKIEINGPARYYFYVHKLAGWVLGSFIAAAVTGLTK